MDVSLKPLGSGSNPMLFVGGNTTQGSVIHQASAARRGVVWQFETQVPVGTYANGDRYVLTSGGVGVIAVTPLGNDPVETIDARNGSEVNPGPDKAYNGFDGRMKTGSFDNLTYDPAFNVDPGHTGQPVAFTAGSQGCLVKGRSVLGEVSDKGGSQRVSPAIQSIECLTFTPEQVPAGGFRPPTTWPDKTTRPNWTLAKLESNMGIFQSSLNLTDPIQFPKHAPEARAERTARLQALQQTFTTGFTLLDTHSPREAVRGYGRNWASTLGLAALDLHSTISLAEKRIIAVAMAQIGLDLVGSIWGGQVWPDNGGWYHGRLMPVLLAGLLFDDADILATALDPFERPNSVGYVPEVPPFSEMKTYNYVSETPYSKWGKEAWGPYLGSSEAGPDNTLNRQDRIPLTPEMLGMPFFAAAGYTYPHWTSNATDATGYLYNYNGSILDQVTAMGLLVTNEDLSPLNPMFDFMSIWVPKVRGARSGLYDDNDKARFGPLGGSISGAEVSRASLDIYAMAPFARAPWEGVPTQPMPPFVDVAGTNITVTPHGYEFGHNSEILTRKIRWSQDDGATWTEIEQPWEAGAPEATVIEVPLEGTQVLVQVALTNAYGQGPWSVNAPNVSPENASSGVDPVVTALRGVVTTGVVDQTAPVLSTAEAEVLSSEVAAVEVTTDTADGEIFWAASTDAAVPSPQQVIAGQDAGGAEVPSNSIPVTSEGGQALLASGLAPATSYNIHLVHRDTAMLFSPVVSTGAVTTSNGQMNLFPAGSFENPQAFSIKAGHAISNGVFYINSPPGTVATTCKTGHLAKVTPGIQHRFLTSIYDVVSDASVRFQLDYLSENNIYSSKHGWYRPGGSTVLASGTPVLDAVFIPPAGAEWAKLSIYTFSQTIICTVGPISISEV